MNSNNLAKILSEYRVLLPLYNICLDRILQRPIRHTRCYWLMIGFPPRTLRLHCLVHLASVVLPSPVGTG
jgi:hypothetical protein